MEIPKPSWIDLAILGVLIWGIIRGRKRGMSEELLDVLKWVMIVVVGSFLYAPIGEFMSTVLPFSLFSCYVTTYAVIMITVLIIFGTIKRAVGSKLMESDCFGAAEYYLGSVAGAFRYTLIIIVAFSFLNARFYSPQEVEASRKFQYENYGFIIFSPAVIQQEVFRVSYVGKLCKNFLYPVMIRPTAPNERRLGGGGSVRAREVDEILD